MDFRNLFFGGGNCRQCVMICRDVTPVASQRVSGIDGIQDFGDISGFNRIQCVRDWSGILLERSGKRYSEKPDGFAGTPR